MVASFKDIKGIIIKCCTAVNAGSMEFAEKYEFAVDIAKMNNIFRQRQLDYHVLACNTTLKSYTPYASDIHNIADYVNNSEELSAIMDGYTQIVFFTVFSNKNKDGSIEFRIDSDNENPLNPSELFSVCNNTNKLNINIAAGIVKDVPNYRIMVTRRFIPNKDKFAYTIHFRSNKEMSLYYKSITSEEQPAQETTTEEVEE